MFKQFLLVVGCAGILCAQNPEGVPKEAKEVGPGQYRLVDRDGKAWIYRRTPFGYSKASEDAKAKPEETSAAAGKERVTPFGVTKVSISDTRESSSTTTPFGESKGPKPAPVLTKITEDGDMLRFERPTPFGPQRWSRKKSELTEDERKLWQSQSSDKTPNSTRTSPQTDAK